MLAEINQWVSRLQAQLAEMVEFNASAEETVDLLTQVPRAGTGWDGLAACHDSCRSWKN
jgi:hypothetical protein